MSVESSFLKDRPASGDEIENLEYDTPTILRQRLYDDLLKVKTVGEEEKTGFINDIEFKKCKTEYWYFRMN
jgi:hypothetical protein